MGAQSARIGDMLRKHVERAMKMLALEIDRNLRRVTPVDTGHARRNWVPSVGQPHAGEVDNNQAHAQGVSEVLAYKLASGEPIWVANATPYILSLNYGHSKQAPAAFVEFAIDQALLTVKSKGTQLDVDSMRAANARNAMQTLDRAGGYGAEGAGNLASAYSPFGDE